MSRRDFQRLVIAAFLTLLLCYSGSVYLSRRAQLLQPEIAYLADDDAAVERPELGKDVKVPIPLPDSQDSLTDTASKGHGAQSEKGAEDKDGGPGKVQDATEIDKHVPPDQNAPAQNPKEDTIKPPTGKLETSHGGTHVEVFSSTTKTKKYLPIDFAGAKVMNPNIIPHPTLDQTWVIVSQKIEEGDGPRIEFQELYCTAVIVNDVLHCDSAPRVLPVEPTPGGKCEGDIAYMSLNEGPHDARVLYGPEKPYIVFGSNSKFTCFGQFVQSFGRLIGWSDLDKAADGEYHEATELQRPGNWSTMEKNWFLFWDDQGREFVHHDVAPRRVMAAVNRDGSVGPNIGLAAAAHDDKCIGRYMPRLGPELESIHQATNSLKITMCRKADPACKPTDDNTFIFTIYQHKTFFNFHSVYEPYVMIFEQQEPFRIHAMSKRPLWIAGRQAQPAKNTSDMFYVTAMSWKDKTRKYHGYMDDELFLTFGIEDASAGAIDVPASAVLKDLGMCSAT